MSITITQSPQAYMPAYNPILYQGLGAAHASAGYYYHITIRDEIVGATSDVSYRYNPRPDGYFIYDASPYVQNYITNSCIINEYGVKVIPCVRRYKVTVKEYNDANPISGAAIDTTDYYFYAWNSAIDSGVFATYDYQNYIMDGTHVPRFKFLTDLLPEDTYEDRSNLFYYLSEANAKDVKEFYIETFDSSGVAISNSTIANSNYSSTNYLNKYIGIDLGYKGLTEISAGDVTGTYPILAANAASYRVTIFINSVLDPNSYVIKTYTIKCSKFPVYTIHALFDNGHFRSVHFNKVSEVNCDNEKVTYSQIPFENNSNVWEYARRSAGEKILSVSETKKITLRTDWLTEDEIELYKNLVSSPVSYLDDGGTDYVQVIPIANSYKVVKKFNKKLYALQLDYRYTMKSYKQRG